MYGRKPIILAGMADQSRVITLEEHIQDKSKRNIQKLLRHQTRPTYDFKVGEYVFFWRDKLRYVGPAKITSISGTVVNLTHNGYTKTSSLNRLRRTIPPLDTPFIDLEDEEDEEIPNIFTTPPSLPWIPERTDQSAANKPLDLNKESEASSSNGYESTNETEIITESEKFAQAERIGKENHTTTGIQTRSRAQENTTNVTFADPLITSDSHSTSFYTTYLNETIGSKIISESEKTSSYAKEIQNWKNMHAFIPISWKDVPKNANIIGSHVVWRRKSDGTVKARICPWGHRDIEKAQLRTDAPCMSEEVFRLVLSLATEFEWTIAEMDITAAYLQAKGFEREIFVRPPQQETSSNQIWKLTKAAYGLADSGRLWYLTSDSAIVEKFGAIRSKLEPTLYYSKNNQGQLKFIMVAQVDNYIYAGDKSNLEKFEAFLHEEFDVGELERQSFNVFGCEINQAENYSITITQDLKTSEIPDNLYRDLNSEDRSGNDLATPKEITAYKSAIGKMLFIGRITQPLFLRIASHMAGKTKNLLLHHLKDLEASNSCFGRRC